MVEALRQNVGKENRNKDARKQTENHELTVMESRYEKLKNQFLELRELRSTEAEEIFQEYKKAAEARDQAQQALLKELRGQLEDVNAELTAARRSAPTDKGKTSSSSGKSEEDMARSLRAAEKEAKEMKELARRTERELAAEIENSKRLTAKLQSSNTLSLPPVSVAKSSDGLDMSEKLRLYEDFTGMLITQSHVDVNGMRFNCVQSGRNGSLQYQITVPQKTPDQIVYTPLLERERDAKLLSMLSEGHQEEITFSRSEQGANFFISLMNALDCSPDSDEEEEGDE